MEVGGQRHAPAALPPGKTRYPLYRRLGEPQSRSGQVRKFHPPTEFDPRTIQPVTSRCTDCDIPSPDVCKESVKFSGSVIRKEYRDRRRDCYVIKDPL
jgi:hypothetical protein